MGRKMQIRRAWSAWSDGWQRSDWPQPPRRLQQDRKQVLVREQVSFKRGALEYAGEVFGGAKDLVPSGVSPTSPKTR